MAKSPAAAAPASDFKTDATHISVKFVGARPHWRAGRKFTATPTPIAKADLTDKEAAAILGDPVLTVTEFTPATPAA